LSKLKIPRRRGRGTLPFSEIVRVGGRKESTSEMRAWKTSPSTKIRRGERDILTDTNPERTGMILCLLELSPDGYSGVTVVHLLRVYLIIARDSS
jgi:hypothetical protein